jgi:hypothetical protein
MSPPPQAQDQMQWEHTVPAMWQLEPRVCLCTELLHQFVQGLSVCSPTMPVGIAPGLLTVAIASSIRCASTFPPFRNKSTTFTRT